MNQRTFLVALVGLLVVLVAASIAVAQTSASFDLSWYVMAGGGGRADGAAHAMNGTLGQGAVGLSGSPGFQMQSGYWYAVLSLPEYSVYLPLVFRSYP